MYSMGSVGIHAKRAASLYGFFLGRNLETLDREIAYEILTNVYGLSGATNRMILRTGQELGYWKIRRSPGKDLGVLDIVPSQDGIGLENVESTQVA